MSKRIRLGGIKILKQCAHLSDLHRNDEKTLGDTCVRLAEKQINLSFLTYIADGRAGQCGTSFCADAEGGLSAYYCIMSDREADESAPMHSNVNLLSIFPHDQRLDIAGALITLLAERKIVPMGFACSSSAMTILTAPEESERLIDGLFEPFEFPAYKSPYDWHAAYKGQEQVLHEIICSYQEKVIKVYNVVRYRNLSFWRVVVPFSKLGDFGKAMHSIHGTGIKAPFLVGQAGEADTFTFAFCLSGSRTEDVLRSFDLQLPSVEIVHQEQKAAFSMHGPHFGDRYGIAGVLLGCLRGACIAPLAISCTVASIMVVVDENDLDRSVESLGVSFHIPAS